eukprot:CAMPEP_0202965678 /NCGR_PEP_ID=MMETSP1396-20130829/9624_1 /ASSEMBLY_ACC=CAM_ASM_000872 /TAXON_ID= /ORGANISM="Pseudokeronopsis sp., Strain Brazil" /LENGTH=58 /DNA_ID=CAMNT_0049688531 /DNA_START=376 /DNA_END=552 /DNA_ORIENTATION=+
MEGHAWKTINVLVKIATGILASALGKAGMQLAFSILNVILDWLAKCRQRGLSTVLVSH